MEKQFLRFSSGSGVFSGLAVFLLLILFSVSALAQGIGINSSGAPSDTSAMLDIKSNTKGLLIPRMTTAERNAIPLPANGLFIYNTDCNNLNYNAGTPTAPNWIQVNINNTIASPGAISGPSAVCPNQTGVTYSIAPVPGASAYTWTLPSGASIVSGQNTTQIIVNFGSSTGNICVTAGNYCGTSSATCLSVTFSAAPSVTSNPSAAVICENGNTGFSVTASGAGLSYQWQENNGSWSNLSNGGVYSNVTAANLGITGATIGMNGRQYKCIVSGTCNPSPAISAAASLTVNALPSSAFTWSPANPATNQSCTFTPGVSGATYSWTFQNGTPATSTAQNPVISWATSGTYSVGLVVTQNGCTSATTTNSITVVIASCVHGSQTFSANGSYNTGSVQTFTVPSNACDPVTIEIWGAQGGNTSQAGGKGARMKGDFTGLAGISLSIIVGQQGESRSSYDGGGGGGTFVWRTATSTPLIIAGGGGGGGGGNGSSWAGIDAVTANNGTNGNGASQGAGVNGNGGTAATGSYWASGGSGWNSVGNIGNGCSNTSSGGGTPLSGGAGGIYGGDYGYNGYGGYGGGGGAQGACNCAGGGGGGGYSGGGPGANCGGGGGGGSYNIGTNQSNSAGVRTGNGSVTISW